MARDVHYVIYSAQKPEVSILVELCSVACKVAARKTRPVGFLETLRVTPDAPEHRGPGLGNSQQPAMAISYRITLVIHYLH